MVGRNHLNSLTPCCASPEFIPSLHLVIVAQFPQLFKFACFLMPFELDVSNRRYPMAAYLPCTLHKLRHPIRPRWRWIVLSPFRLRRLVIHERRNHLNLLDPCLELIPCSHLVVVVRFPKLFKNARLLVHLELDPPYGGYPMGAILPGRRHNFGGPILSRRRRGRPIVL